MCLGRPTSSWTIVILCALLETRKAPPAASQSAGDDATASKHSVPGIVGRGELRRRRDLDKAWLVELWSGDGWIVFRWAWSGHGNATKEPAIQRRVPSLPMRARPCLPPTQAGLTRASGHWLCGQCQLWAPANSSTASRWPQVAEPGSMRQVRQLSEVLCQIWLGFSKTSAHDAGR